MPTPGQILLEDAQMQEAVVASLAEQKQQNYNVIAAGQVANLEAQKDAHRSNQYGAVTSHQSNKSDKSFDGIQQPLKLRLKKENARNGCSVSGKRKRIWRETIEETRPRPYQETPNAAVERDISNSLDDECDINDGNWKSPTLSDDARIDDYNDCSQSIKKEGSDNEPQDITNIDAQQSEPIQTPQFSPNLMRSFMKSCEREPVKLAQDLVEWCKDNETQKSWLEVTAHRILQELLLSKTTTATAIKSSCVRENDACSGNDEGQKDDDKCVDANFASPYLPNFNAELGESAFEMLNKLMDPDRSDSVKTHRDVLFGSGKGDRMVEATAYIQNTCAVFHPLWAKDYKLTEDAILLCLDQKKLAQAYPFSLRLIAEELKLWELLTVLLDDWDLKESFHELFANVKEGGWQSSSKTDVHCLLFVCRAYRVAKALQWTNIEGRLARKVKHCLKILQKNSQNKENIAVRTLRSLQQENAVNRNLAGNGILPNDVLFDRGEADVTNAGNKKFDSIVAEYQEEFFRAATKTTEDRNAIVNMIIDRVWKNGGRFLTKQDDDSNGWTVAPQKKIVAMVEKILYDAMYKRFGSSRGRNENEKGDNPRTPSNTRVANLINGNDVLWGRGLEVKNHVGNIKFRSIFAEYKVKFLQTKEREVELGIVTDIVERVLQNGGRFLKHDEKNNVWVEVPRDKASEDAAQSLLAAKYKKLQQATGRF